jgi:hypothetical protein
VFLEGEFQGEYVKFIRCCRLHKNRSQQVNIDWHSSSLTRLTIVDKDYKNTQNVRRFMMDECGPDFRFDREFMAWIRNNSPKNLGDVVDEWKRRHSL